MCGGVTVLDGGCHWPLFGVFSNAICSVEPMQAVYLSRDYNICDRSVYIDLFKTSVITNTSQYAYCITACVYTYTDITML